MSRWLICAVAVGLLAGSGLAQNEPVRKDPPNPEKTSFVKALHASDAEAKLDEVADPVVGEWTDARKEELSAEGNLVPDLVLVGGTAERVADGLELSDDEDDKGVLTRTVYTVPVKIELVAKTDSTNLRLYFSRGLVILNWEAGLTELRYHEPRRGLQQGYPGKGKVKAGEWHTIAWEINDKGTKLSVDGQERFVEAGDLAGVRGRVGIGTAWGAAVTVKSLKVR